jgi:GNAT superfamily N-acetyltransferase
MSQQLHTTADCDLLHAGSTVVKRHILQTSRGTVFLQSYCPPSLVERLRADDGLRAFARFPSREYQLLLDLARHPECALALAYTPDHRIVGQVTLAPADHWWQGLANTYEIAVEVSSPWRRLGIAHQLLRLALDLPALERMILLAMGLCWHWDTAGLGLSPFRYRELLARLLAAHAFVEYPTTEPNIQENPANILLVRLGSQVDQQTLNRFFSCVFRSNTLPGL